jgi:hypothetical protein
MGGIRTVRGQSAVDMDGFPAFSGEIKGGGSVLVFAVTTASKAAKKLDRLHFHGLPKLRRNMSLGKLLAQLAGTALSNTLWSIRTVRTVLAFALLVILMRQTREDPRPFHLTAVILNISHVLQRSYCGCCCFLMWSKDPLPVFVHMLSAGVESRGVEGLPDTNCCPLLELLCCWSA